MITIPSAEWGVNLLDDPNLSLAPTLWAHAEAAGFAEPTENVAEGAIEEEEALKRLKRQFGHPYMNNPPNSCFVAFRYELLVRALRCE